MAPHLLHPNRAIAIVTEVTVTAIQITAMMQKPTNAGSCAVKWVNANLPSYKYPVSSYRCHIAFVEFSEESVVIIFDNSTGES